MLVQCALEDDVQIKVLGVHTDGQIFLLPLVSSLLDILQSLVRVMVGHVLQVQPVLMLRHLQPVVQMLAMDQLLLEKVHELLQHR